MELNAEWTYIYIHIHMKKFRLKRTYVFWHELSRGNYSEPKKWRTEESYSAFSLHSGKQFSEQLIWYSWLKKIYWLVLEKTTSHFLIHIHALQNSGVICKASMLPWYHTVILAFSQVHLLEEVRLFLQDPSGRDPFACMWAGLSKWIWNTLAQPLFKQTMLGGLLSMLEVIEETKTIPTCEHDEGLT